MPAKEGEIITCSNGHPLYRLRYDIYSGEPMRASSLETVDERLPTPQFGSVVPDCPECGAPVLQSGELYIGGRRRTGEGWELMGNGELTMPEYIEGLAKGRIRQDRWGIWRKAFM